MSPTYTIDPARRWVCITYIDQPKFAELQAVFETIFQDPVYQRGFDFLIDRSQVRETASVAFAQQAADFITSHPSEFTDVRWAVVVTDAANFGMARMIHGMAGIGYSGQVFFDHPSAERWLLEGQCAGNLAHADMQDNDDPAHAHA